MITPMGLARRRFAESTLLHHLPIDDREKLSLQLEDDYLRCFQLGAELVREVIRSRHAELHQEAARNTPAAVRLKPALEELSSILSTCHPDYIEGKALGRT